MQLIVVKFSNCNKKKGGGVGVIRIMSGAEPRTSCRGLFRKLEILPAPCQYILSLMLFIIDNPNNLGVKGAVCGLRVTYPAGVSVPLKPEKCHLLLPCPMHA